MVSMNIFSVEFILRRGLKISRKVFDFKVNPASSVKWESPRCCRRSIRGHGHVAPPAGSAGGGHHAAARVAAHARHVRARADADRVPPARAGCRGVGRCRRPVEAKRWWRIKTIKKNTWRWFLEWPPCFCWCGFHWNNCLTCTWVGGWALLYLVHMVPDKYVLSKQWCTKLYLNTANRTLTYA